MKKTRTVVSILLLFSMALSLCSCLKSESPDAPDTEQPPSAEQTETVIHGIAAVSYPNISAVSRYDELTSDQKLAYDALGGALTDILKNQPEDGRTYHIEKRVSMKDCMSVRDLLLANFAAAEDIINALVFTDSGDSVDKADTIVLNTPDDDFTESYKSCISVIKLAENVLKDIDNDGTEYGKALAIAQWMKEKVIITAFKDPTSPTYYEEKNYLERKPNTVYGALSYKEADVNGAAKLYDFLCKRAGLETICVKALSSDGEIIEDTAWNMICIDAKWYHINIEMMDRCDDSTKYFMMPDSFVKYCTNHTAQYYYDLSAEKSIAPVADSYDMYRYAYNSIDDMIRDFESGENDLGTSYLAALPNGGENKTIRYTGEITSKPDGTVYYMNVSINEDSMDAAGNTDLYNISFTKKLEAVLTESGKSIITYDPKDAYCVTEDGEATSLPDENWYMTMEVPCKLVSDGTDCMKYDYTENCYYPVMGYSLIMVVDSDYVMDESVVELYNRSIDDTMEICQGKSDAGCDYVLYKPKDYNQNSVSNFQVFIRATDRCIVPLVCSSYLWWETDIDELLSSIKIIDNAEAAATES